MLSLNKTISKLFWTCRAEPTPVLLPNAHNLIASSMLNMIEAISVLFWTRVGGGADVEFAHLIANRQAAKLSREC